MARRTDSNQAVITAALRAAGVHVLDLHTVGGGCPDLLYCVNDPERGWVTGLMELKMPEGRLKASQVLFRETWPGVVVVVRTVTEALAAVGIEEVPA